jgi:hypothetical protein
MPLPGADNAPFTGHVRCNLNKGPLKPLKLKDGIEGIWELNPLE